MAVKAQNQVTIVDLTDAYSIMLSMDAVALNGGTNTLGSQQSAVVNVSAFRGADQLTPAVGTPTCPTNVSASVGSASNMTVPVTITFASALSASGKVVIPVTVDGITIEKIFSFAIAFKGTSGTSVKISKTEYQAGSSNTTAPTGTWSTSVVSVAEGKYLWTKRTYSDGTVDYSVARQGEDGSSGADALTLVIVSSDGTIFKNTAIATTLTAHVYKGGAEITGSALTALGTIKWYKDGGSTAVASGATLTISAGDVADKAIYEATLEG